MTRADLVSIDGVDLGEQPTYQDVASDIRAVFARAERLAPAEPDRLVRAVAQHLRAWRPIVSLEVSP